MDAFRHMELWGCEVSCRSQKDMANWWHMVITLYWCHVSCCSITIWWHVPQLMGNLENMTEYPKKVYFLGALNNWQKSSSCTEFFRFLPLIDNIFEIFIGKIIILIIFIIINNYIDSCLSWWCAYFAFLEGIGHSVSYLMYGV